MVNTGDQVDKQQKAALRRRFRQYRAHLSDFEYATKSQSIVQSLLALPEIKQARTVHTYWPMLHQREIDTRHLISSLHAQKKQIVLPVVVNFSWETGTTSRLRHVPYAATDSLRPNRWGIHEPITENTIPVDRIDVIIVPALGAGRNGYRIGHGYGFYDELLEGLSVSSICLIYDKCLVDTVPFEEHDVRMSVLITEHEVLHLETM